MTKANLESLVLDRLIADRPAISDAISASVGTTEDFSEPTELETISLFCRQPHSWEFFVSAAGYLDLLSKEEELSLPEIIETIVEERNRAVGYFDQIGNLPFEQVLLAGKEAAEKVNKDKKLKIVHMVSSLSFCRSKCGKDLKCLEECLTERSSPQRSDTILG